MKRIGLKVLPFVLGSLFLLAPGRAFGERFSKKRVAVRDSSIYYTQTKPKNVSKFNFGISFGPTADFTNGNKGTENSASVSYQINPNLSIGYLQYINSRQGGSQVPDEFYLDDGYFKAGVENIWKDRQYHTSLRYEPRIYLPTERTKADAGMMFIMRNYFTVTHPISSKTKFSISEVPIIHVYNRAGVISGTTRTANPAFENRIGMGFDFDLGQGFSASLPVWFNITRYASFDVTATNNNATDLKLQMIPSVAWTQDTVSLSLTYYTGNFLAKDASSTTVVNDNWADGTLALSLGVGF